jgi:hypothetical protein
MDCKFVFATVIAFAAAAASVSGTALAQNQTSVPANGTASNATLDSIKEQYLSEWNRTEFNATFSAFV